MNTGNQPSPREYQLYQKVITDSGDVIAGMDERYAYLFASKAFLQYVGLSKADIMGRTAVQMLGEHKELKTHIDKSLRGKRTTFEMPFTHSRLGNRFLHLKCYPIKENGIRAVVMVARDITGLKRREQALRSYQQMYRTFMDHATDILLLMDPDGIIISCSKFLDKQAGLSTKDVIGRSVQTLLSPASYEVAVMHIKDWKDHHARSQSWEAEVMGADGGVVLFDIHSTPVYKEGSLKQVVIVARNITEHKRIEEELKHSCSDLEARLEMLTRQSQERLRQMEEEFQQFSLRQLEAREREHNAIGHELHDEVGGYLTMLGLLLSKMAKESGGKVWMEQIMQIFDEMTEYIRSLTHTLYPVVLQRDGLLAALVEYFKSYQRRTSIKVNFKHRGIQRRLYPDIGTSVYRIVQEALTNVAKHAEVATVKVTLYQQKNIIRTSVQDNGKGFDISKIKSTTAGISGMEDRALIAGGKLVVDSSPGQGTRVTYTLPIPQVT